MRTYRSNSLDDYLITPEEDLYPGAEVCVQVVGVTFENRQLAIQNLDIHHAVYLHREPDNKYDANAIHVKCKHNISLGYIPELVAEKIAPILDAAGKPVRGKVYWLTPRTKWSRNIGLYIRFTLPRPETADQSTSHL